MTRNEARTEIGLDPLEEWEEEDLAPPQLPMFGENGNGREREEMENELRQWRTWAENRVGKGFDREFETFSIPPALAGAINGALEGAKSVTDVERVFSDIWMGYP